MVGPLYLSAVEFVKKRPFDVYVPAFYHPNMPDDLVNPSRAPLERVNRFKMVATKKRNPAPFYRPLDPHQLQRAAYTIENMLVMFNKQVEFELVNEEDVVEIFEGIDRYLETLREDIRAGSEPAVEYARLLIKWREEVYKHYYRYMMTHPTSLETLYPNNDKKQNIFALLSALNGTSQETLNLDPLRAKAKPPYEINDVKPGEKVTNSDMDIESSLGLSKKGIMQDDGRDFNFDDFIKRS